MKLRPFEIALLVIFAIMAIAALVILRTTSSGGTAPGDENFVGPVDIWGTLPAASVTTILTELTAENEELSGVTYRYIPAERFDDILTDALADSAGPDMIIASHEELTEQRKRIEPVSYEYWPVRDFQDAYIDGARVFTLSDGVYSRPILVDPLMLYWNKNILTNNGFLSAPRTWEELVNVQLPALIDRSFDRSINRGVVAFGTYDNVKNAYGVLSTLLIQGGSSLVSEVIINSRTSYTISLNSTRTNESAEPFVNSLTFYLRFAQPSNQLYSWNRSFSSDRSEFISEDLVFYFGYSSEARELEKLNPNFDFDIAEVPQGASAENRRTYGKFYGMSTLRTSDNKSGTLLVMNLLGSDSNVSVLANLTGMVPVKRTLVTNGSNDIFGRVAYRSAPITYGWLNPDRNATGEVFSEMVNDVSENRSNVKSSIGSAQQKLGRLYD